MRWNDRADRNCISHSSGFLIQVWISATDGVPITLNALRTVYWDCRWHHSAGIGAFHSSLDSHDTRRGRRLTVGQEGRRTSALSKAQWQVQGRRSDLKWGILTNHNKRTLLQLLRATWDVCGVFCIRQTRQSVHSPDYEYDIDTPYVSKKSSCLCWWDFHIQRFVTARRDLNEVPLSQDELFSTLQESRLTPAPAN